MIVQSLMSSPAITVREDASFQQALALMQKHRIRRLPVVDESGRLIGIVAERDVLFATLRFLQSRVDVAEVMTRAVLTVAPEMPLQRAALTMLENKVGGLPVVDGDRLVGIITESDIFRRFVELQTAEDASAAPGWRSVRSVDATWPSIRPEY
jgi:CBS domain-containing protein